MPSDQPASKPPAVASGRPLRPVNLYKTVGLLFLLGLIYHYLDPITHVLLLGYAAVVLAVIFNALIQLFPAGRKWIAGLLGLLIIGSVAALLWFGFPLLLTQLRGLTAEATQFSQLVTNVEHWLKANTGLNVELMGAETQRFLRNSILGEGGGSGLLSKAQGLLGLLLVPLIILFGSLYAAAKPNDQLLTPLLRTVPRERRESFRRIFALLGDRLLGWAKGVLIGMLAVGVLSYIGYTLAGVPNSLILAVIAALTEAVPIAGPWVGGGIATIAGFLHDPATGLYAAIVAVAVQQLENNLIVPWAMSEAAEVHPFVTLFALVLFGSLFGFLGILLSIPLVLLIATVVQVLWVERAIDAEADRIRPVVDE
ncbi:MAG TPA: AI-2E family transporter [Longimicrobiaceae bacterium]|nr:AI-2E family transporter [Longimicrobiaceae bacterium]